MREEQYLVYRIWKANTTVSSMRLFDNFDDAWDYYNNLSAQYNTVIHLRMYTIYSDQEPKLIRNSTLQKQHKQRLIDVDKENRYA